MFPPRQILAPPLMEGSRRPSATYGQFLAVPALLCAAWLALLYAPTAWSLSQTLWKQDAHSHGPLVLAVAIWLFLRGIADHRAEGAKPHPRALMGGFVLIVGLMLYVVGRSQAIYLLEAGSAVPVLLGSILLTSGVSRVKRLWFAFAFLLFIVPLPVSLIDTITQPMKIFVSWAVEWLMHGMGYPIGRAGVVLAIGPYQLLVADACSGLNSLFMLEAFGLLYLNVVRHESALRNVVLATLIVPISLLSNVARVMTLALVTFHLGDEYAQGFIHSFSGMVLFGVALFLTIAADGAVRAIASLRSSSPPERLATSSKKRLRAAQWHHLDAEQNPAVGRPTWRPSLVLAASAISASVASWALTPPAPSRGVALDLEVAIPTQFGDWTRVDRAIGVVDVVPKNQDGKSLNVPYDGVVLRVYANSRGEKVALAVAYASDQRQETKIHRPEVCYVAAGYSLPSQDDAKLLPGTFNGEGGIPGRRLLAQTVNNAQAVSYWIRIGDAYPQSGWAFRRTLLENAWNQRKSDGVLIRASSQASVGKPSSEAFALNERFLSDLVSALPELARNLLVGLPLAKTEAGREASAFN